MSKFTALKTAATFGVALGTAQSVSAADTPYDLIRPVYPMTWDTLSDTAVGTVLSFSKFVAGKDDSLLGIPELGSKPADFKPNGYISDSLDQAYIDALNLKVSNIRVNQAGYLPDDPEKQFYYTTSGKCEDVSYTVVDLDGKELAKGGTLTSTDASADYKRSVKAYSNAIIGRYTVERAESSKIVCIGKLAEAAGLPNNQRLRIKVGKEYSSTFIISENVYSMLRDATLKFFGAQRSGNSESWFHGPSHVNDTIPGGWYDAGDYLKEGPTMTYAFMMLSALATLHPERDADHYAYNHNETVKTDGIPDILREARHGAEFFLRSYEHAEGELKDMAVTIGYIASDHLLWDRPENIDSRADAPARPLFHGIGPKFSGAIAAGLAFLSQSYATYDKTFADSCLKVAEKLYAYGKANKDEKEICDKEAYPCIIGPNDNLAMAAIALHYATYEKSKKIDYLTDLTDNREINDNSTNAKYTPVFAGGWFGIKSGFYPGGWVNDYENTYSIALYAFYKLFLADSSASVKYGLSDSLRTDFTERTVYELIRNAANGAEGDEFITLPHNKGVERMHYSGPWYNFLPMEWGVNGYDVGQVLTMLAYAEITKDIESKKIINAGSAWNYSEVRQIAINKMNNFLGMNRWDISFVMGVGDKNEAHLHSRMANPEFWNGSSLNPESYYQVAPYKYSSLVGAFMGGALTETLLSDVETFTSTEATLSSATTLLAATVLLASENAPSSSERIKKNDVKGTLPASLKIAQHENMLNITYHLAQTEPVKVKLLSVSGKQVMQYSGVETAGSHQLQWNLEHIPAGSYVVAVWTGSQHEHKIVRIGR